MKTIIKNDRRGFSFMELVVVIAVLTILIGIALPSLQAYIRNGKEIERDNHLDLVSKSIRQYYAYEGIFPDLTGLSPGDGLTELSPEQTAELQDLIRSVTGTRIITDKYIYFYDEKTGECSLEIK